MAKEYRETVHDLRIKYEGCFALQKEPIKGTSPVVVIDSVRGDKRPSGFAVSVYKRGPKNSTQHESVNVGIDDLILEDLPVGCINTARCVMFLDKQRPRDNRRYRALACRDSIQLIDVARGIREKLEMRPPRNLLDYFVLNAWATNEYSNPQEALNMVESNEYIARAFNSRFYFTMALGTERTLLMYKTRVAGIVKDGTIVLKKWSKRFKDELEGYGLAVK